MIEVKEKVKLVDRFGLVWLIQMIQLLDISHVDVEMGVFCAHELLSKKNTFVLKDKLSENTVWEIMRKKW